MADIAIGVVERVIKLVFEVKKLAERVCETKEDIDAMGRFVVTLNGILSFQQRNEVRMNQMAMAGVLVELEAALNKANELLMAWQGFSATSRAIRARKWSKKLSQVRGEIMQYMITGVFTVLSTQPQGAGELSSNISDHSTTDDVRSGVVPATKTEFRSSELEAAAQHFSDEGITGGNHSFLYKCKIVLKVSMMHFAEASSAGISGVVSVDKDMERHVTKVVVNDGVEPIALLTRLRKMKIAATILKVEDAGAEEASPVILSTMDARNSGIRDIIDATSSVVERTHTPAPATSRGRRRLPFTGDGWEDHMEMMGDSGMEVGEAATANRRYSHHHHGRPMEYIPAAEHEWHRLQAYRWPVDEGMAAGSVGVSL